MTRKKDSIALDDELRAKYAYREANPWCEVVEFFPKWSRTEVKVPSRVVIHTPDPVTTAHLIHAMPGTILAPSSTGATDIHHIFGGILGRNRHEAEWNWSHQYRVCHEFCEAYPTDGMVLSLAAKLKRNPRWWAECWPDAQLVLRFSAKGVLQKECRFEFAEQIRQKILA